MFVPIVRTINSDISRLYSFTQLAIRSPAKLLRVGEGGPEEFRVGQTVACAGNQYVFHAEYN
jgi:hypothetical protein